MVRLLQNPRAGLIAILLVAAFVRLLGIASRPIWYDEAFSILFSEKGPAAILIGTLSTNVGAAADIHPPAYYFLLWSWMRGFGQTLVSTRSLSILAGVGIVALTWLLGKRLIDQQIALIAALFAAILPFQVHYSQEIRMYVFTTLGLTLAVFAFWQGAQKRSTTPAVVWWALFALSAALAQYSHNLAAIYLVLLALTPVFQKDWKTLRAVALAGFVSLILYFPWLIQLPAQFAKIEHGYWIEKPGIDRLFTLFLLYLPNLPVPAGPWLMPILLLSTLIIALAAYQTFQAVKHKDAGARIGLWLAYLSFGPALLMWLISQIRPIYIERALLPSHVMFCLWLAWALFNTDLPHLVRNIALTLIAISTFTGIYQHLTYTGFPYAPYAQADAYLQEHIEPGEVIVHSSKLSLLPAVYYGRDLPQMFIADPAGSGTDTLAPITRQILRVTAAADMESATQGASRLWFIIFRQSIDEFTRVGYQTHPHLQYLDEHFELQAASEWQDLLIFLYSRK